MTSLSDVGKNTRCLLIEYKFLLRVFYYFVLRVMLLWRDNHTAECRSTAEDEDGPLKLYTYVEVGFTLITYLQFYRNR
jgi:hypothetical protein